MSREKNRKKSNKNRMKRALNIIYFVDSNKTRSFKVSLKKIYIISGVFATLFIWSVSGVFIFGKFYEKNELMKDQLHGALSTIFEYQSRYDGVYEQAYPRIEDHLVESHNHKEKTSDQENEIPEEAQTEGQSSDEIREEPKIAFVKQTIDFPQESTRKQSNSEWPIIVEDVSFHQDMNDIELNFAIRNSHSPDKVEGYIWSVLTFENSKGTKSYIASPSGIKINEHGDLMNPGKGANWYSIRYYKAKSFYFQPPDTDGKVTEILIGMKDLHGGKSFIRLPVRDGQAGAAPSASNGDKQGLQSSQ